MLRVALALFIACGVAAGQSVRPAEKPFIECDPAELLRAVPDLAGTKFDAGQDGLDALLKATGENLSGMLAKMVDLTAAEQIHELRFETDKGEANRQESFRYLVSLAPNDAHEPFTESRLLPGAMTPAPPPNGDFLIAGHFLKLLRYLLPQFQDQSTFRYVGRLTAAGQDSFVVAFAQHSGSTQPRSHIAAGEGRTALLEGLVWIDAATHRIVRLRADVVGQLEGSSLETVATDISLVNVNFASTGTLLWLPATVTVHGHYASGDLHSVHRYSDYRLYIVEDDATPEQKARHAGVASATAPSAADAWELLDRGMSLVRENKSAEAAAPLREAVRLNPRIPDAHFQLAVALRAANDFAGAEAELREALKLSPDSGSSHNLLGILLFKRGDMSGAVTELRAGAQLQASNATVHFNLAQALERNGDRKSALEEYHAASTLAPDNANFKARYEQLEHAANTPPAVAAGSGATIKVEVRQVLVPVVVMDKEGHHATGLTQADFHVFEDGVEQKITSFTVENAGVATAAAAPAAAETPAAATSTAPAFPTSPKPVPIRRTYVICIDALHTQFGNLVRIRDSVAKMFRTEQAGDARYILLSVGTSTQVVQNSTADPADILKAVDSKDFQKTFLASRKSSGEADIREFRRALDEARLACDQRAPECEAFKRTLPSQATQIASLDRVYTLSFLAQFRGLVEQMRQGSGRRTIILFSDGFQLVPGQLAYELLGTYFPEFHTSFRAVDRMPDLEPVLRLAANSNIPIYTIDSRGLYTSSYYDAANSGGLPSLSPMVLRAMDQDATEAGATLSEIAAATGGTAFRNSNDIFAGLQRAFADGRQYYMLAYVPGNSNSDGKFRAITVRVQNSKLLVRAKRGYWATGASN